MHQYQVSIALLEPTIIHLNKLSLYARNRKLESMEKQLKKITFDFALLPSLLLAKWARLSKISFFNKSD